MNFIELSEEERKSTMFLYTKRSAATVTGDIVVKIVEIILGLAFIAAFIFIIFYW
ncbi:MAG: hypothetical protein LBS61_03770 [Endomicrobium sp.]|nr:hypothetical protein [Endomicrobium sp.]